MNSLITPISKLSQSDISIFTIMSALAKDHEAINLGQGFPDFDCDEQLQQLVVKYLRSGKNQYCPMPGLLELRQAISDKIHFSHGVRLNPVTQICVTSGASQGLFSTITGFVHPGEEVIIIEPAYDSYIPSVLVAGGIPKIYAMTYPDYTIDWNQIEQMVNDKTKMIIINTPHNPTGTILQAEDMKALESIVADKNIIVLSDEVYEHIIFDGATHHSVIRYPKLFEQSIATFSFGKTLHATGWKIGYCVGPPHLIESFRNVHQWNVFCVNSFLQYAIAEYIQRPETYTTLSAFFQQKRDFLNDQLAGTPLVPLLSKGTYFQLFNYEQVSDLPDRAFAKYLTEAVGVASIPLSPFYSKPIEDKVIRLCFAKEEGTMRAAAARLNKLGAAL